MSASPHRKRHVVLLWPGEPIVSVRVVRGGYAIMLAKPGDVAATPQYTCASLNEAIMVAREGAEMCSWRFVGVLGEEHFHRIADHRRTNDEDAA